MNRSIVPILTFVHLCCWQVGCRETGRSTTTDGRRDTIYFETNPDEPVTVLLDGPTAVIPDGALDAPLDVVPDGRSDAPIDAVADGGTDAPITAILDGGTDGPDPVLLDGATDTSPTMTPTLYAMSATLASTDAGFARFPLLPARHDFSVLIDWNANTATSGANGAALQVALVQSSDSDWDTREPVEFKLGLYSVPSLTYDKLTFHRSKDGCTATASGTYWHLADWGDTIHRKPFTATMTGVIDRAGPQFAIVPTGVVHPLSFSGVMADELMPTGTTAVLEGAGATMALTTSPPDTLLGVSGFLLPQVGLLLAGKALAFATTYNLRVLPPPADLAGNKTTGLPTFSTLADPGLFAQDGFEGPLKAYMVGPVGIADSASLPIPAGKKALAIPPYNFSGTCEARFTVVMAVAPGATTVKLSYLSYRTKDGRPWIPLLFSYTFAVAVPNGDVLPTVDTNLKTSPLPPPWTGDLPGSTGNVYGDLQEALFALPAGAKGQILFDISRACNATTSDLPKTGLIIDNLRIE